MPRRNVELKLRPAQANLAQLVENLRRLGATHEGLLRQRDTYFCVPHGRLKLRQTVAGQDQLVWYDRPNASVARPSEYILTPVEDAASLLESLTRALGVRVVVAKERHFWLHGRTRVHLDQVEGLGFLVEFEAVLAAGECALLGQNDVAYLQSALGLADAQVVPESYSDLLMANLSHG